MTTGIQQCGLIPESLKSLPQWVVWKKESRNGKLTKVPYRARNHTDRAAVDDPKTWGTYDEAVATLELWEDVDGVGFVFTKNDPYCGIDLDGCRNPKSGELEPWAQEIIRTFHSYAEISATGTGVHIIVQGTLPPRGRHKGSVEMYDCGRYFTMTGQHLDGTPETIESRQAELTALHKKIFSPPNAQRRCAQKAAQKSPANPSSNGNFLTDDELINKACGDNDGGKFRRLWSGNTDGYPSASEGDQALCNKLAFYTGKDPSRMDSLFRRSGLYRAKWDEQRGDLTYGQITINKAIAATADIYQPPRRKHHNGTRTNDIGDSALTRELGRLAKLGPAEYGQQRCAAAKKLQMGVVWLDKSVEQVRQQGKTIENSSIHPHIEPPPHPYRMTPNGLVYLKPTDKGPISIRLTNFTATIDTEITEDDGAETKMLFAITASLDGRTFHFSIPASQYAGMSWVTEYLGAEAIIFPGHSIKEHTRVALQQVSTNIQRQVVYKHLGWRKIDDHWHFLHAGGAIGGEMATLATFCIQVDLHQNLSHYVLPDPPTGQSLREAIRASLQFLILTRDAIVYPLYAAIFRAVLGAVNSSIHVCGGTGVGKTELASLIQRHFGPLMDALHLPGSWSSTGNALEGLLFLAKDVICVVDDFVLAGSSYDVQRAHRDADRVFRAQGNRSGRGRLSADATLRTIRSPRGYVVSTGEDTPRGQSLQARLLAIEVGPHDVDWDHLSSCQDDASRGLYAQALAGFLQWVAPQYEEIKKNLTGNIQKLRSQAVQAGNHRRTPEIVANLFVGLQVFLSFAYQVGAITLEEKQTHENRCWAALGEASINQQLVQEASEPTQHFLELLNAVLASGHAHVAGRNGDAPRLEDNDPSEDQEVPKAWGWRMITIGTGDYERSEWRPQGDRIGLAGR